MPKKRPEKGSEKRRYHRYRLQNLKGASVRFTQLEGEHGQAMVRPLFNVSYKGLGFHPQENDAKVIPSNKKIKAQLELLKSTIPISIEVIYQAPEFFGARIELENQKDIDKIIRFISPLELGQSLKAIRPENLRQQADELVFWYVGQNNTEIVIWRNQHHKLLRFRMVFLLYTVEGHGPSQTLKTADIDPAKLGYLPIFESWPESQARWHEETNRDVLQLAQEILAHSPAIRAEDLKDLNHLISAANVIAT